MVDGIGAVAGPGVSVLRAQAAQARTAAAELEEVAVTTERRLVPVLARLGPGVWTGRAAGRVESAADDAHRDLAVAADSLREVAQDLRLSAATLSWRAEELAAGAAPSTQPAR